MLVFTSLGSIKYTLPFITRENTVLTLAPRRRFAKSVFLTRFIGLYTLSESPNRFLRYTFSLGLSGGLESWPCQACSSRVPWTSCPGWEATKATLGRRASTSWHSSDPVLHPSKGLRMCQGGSLWGKEGNVSNNPSQLKHVRIQAGRRGWRFDHGTSTVPHPWSAARQSMPQWITGH